MRRRNLLSLAAGAAVAPALDFAAQQDRDGALRRLAVFTPVPPGGPLPKDRLDALTEGLVEFGWTVGNNIQLDHFGGAGTDRGPEIARQIVAQRPDLILAVSTPSVAAVWRIAGSIPIVFAAVSDPVGQHFIESLAHPGGTITGFTNFEPTMGGKWLELLKEIAPAVTYAGLIYNPSTAPNMNSFEGSFQSASSGLGVTLADMPVHDDAELDRAIASVGNEPNGGLVFPTDPFTNFRGRHTAELAASLRLPAIQPFKTFVEDGGLISYGTNISELYRRSASYIDRILRGARPADLPVQLPTKFELAINLKAARALGLNVSQVLLARADSVIE
jgi:putative tryptophan/tyrosine transport system substrate-binding protein